MARAKGFSFREFSLLLKANGYAHTRTSGDHVIYSDGTNIISIPHHGKKLNRMVCRRLIKENELKVIN